MTKRVIVCKRVFNRVADGVMRLFGLAPTARPFGQGVASVWMGEEAQLLSMVW